MRINLFVAMLFCFSFFKSQTACNYTEFSPVSEGTSCNESILIFTSSVNTIVKGEISALDKILIMPSPNYSITILPSTFCDCSADPGDTGGTTIGTKRGGNGGVQKKLQSTPQETVKTQELIIETNPVDNLLILSLKKKSIKIIKIYNVNGQEELRKDSDNKKLTINVSKLTKGAYWVKAITKENQVYTKQFIKK